MKKLFALILVILMLTACSSEGSDILTDRKKPAAEPSKSFTSSIFGRNVKYDAFTPAEGLALPIPSDEIKDMVQIEKRLYFLGNGAVYTIDIETGEAKKLFDTDAEMFTTHGGKIYTYCTETSVVSEYDTSGTVTKELTIEVNDVDSVLGLSVTDDYYIFKCEIAGKMYMETYLFIYSRETEELTLSKKMSLWGIDLYLYKGNKLLSVSEDDSAPYLGVFDAESGKNERLHWLNTEYRPAVAYCPKTDTALVFGVPSSGHLKYNGIEMLEGNSPCCIYEYSLDDTDEIIHNRYYFDTSQDTRFFISVYENIVSAISSADNEYRIFDYLNPPESITILGYIYNLNMIYGFEKETGILLKEAHTDFEKLVLKLMAGDDDFDIFNTSGAYHDYVDSGAYIDLKGIESLNSRISGNTAADFIVSYDGKYFGVPVQIESWFTEEKYPEDGSAWTYSRIVSENIYYTRNVDVAEQRYSDSDGDELYKLFKFINDYPEGNRKKMPFGDSVTVLGDGGVYLLNPKSHNYDNAVKLLEYIFDCYNGDIPGIIPEDSLYPNLESTENCYAEWRCRPLDIIDPIFDARNTILNQKGGLSNSELKKLAKETAAKVRMRMME